MERRVLLAISLSFLVLFLFQSLVPPPAEPPGEGSTPSAGTAVSTPSATTPSAVAPGSSSAPPPAAAVRGEEREREI
ncbi:MAG: hypothetical protein AB7I50_18235, partial [Vicinamibacterales bacterium]